MKIIKSVFIIALMLVCILQSSNGQGYTGIVFNQSSMRISHTGGVFKAYRHNTSSLILEESMTDPLLNIYSETLNNGVTYVEFHCSRNLTGHERVMDLFVSTSSSYDVIQIIQPANYSDLTAGSLSCSKTSIPYKESPGWINGSSPSGGLCSNYSYTWRKQEAGGEWETISNATGANYYVPVLTISTTFERIVSCDGSTASSNLNITVANAPGKVLATQSENYLLSYNPQIEVKTDDELYMKELCNLGASIQYYDGLGRGKQLISVSSSPQKSDIIQPFDYNELGRQDKNYLPYALYSSSNLGAMIPETKVLGDQATYFVMEYDVENGTKAYSQSVFEPSPLNRVEEQGAPGYDWQPSSNGGGHTVKMEYGFNSSNDVLVFNVVDDQLVNESYYRAHQLYKTITKDENWITGKLNTTEEYKNKQGQVLLKRSYVYVDDVITPVETYYVYDDYGLLRYVIPPEAVSQMFNSQGTTASEITLISGNEVLSIPLSGDKQYILENNGSLTLKHGFSYKAYAGNSLSIKGGNVSPDLVYVYRYDNRKRMIEKKIPGAELVYMVYDKRDRLVATQDGEMRKNEKWFFTKYDAMNRPIAAGIYSSSQSRDQLQSILNAQNIYFESRSTSRHGYSNNSWPQAPLSNDYLSVTYYDDYSFPGKKGFETVHNVSDETTFFTGVKGLVTGTLTQVLDGNEFTSSAQWISSTSYYDDRYRVIQSISDLYPANSSNKVVFSTNYDFAGKVENTKQVQSFQGTTKTIEERFIYDHAGRLLEHHHNLDGIGEVLIAKNEYNQLGELIKKYVGGTTDVTCAQVTNYSYNIRGWLTQLNNPNIAADAKRKFSMRLHYNDSVSGLTNAAQYNGNISAIEWRTTSDGNIGSPNGKQAYGFEYDALNRLTDADYGEGDNFTSNANAFNVSGIQYDLNGNILHLNRQMAIKTGNAAFTTRQIDNLSYAYAGNQLLSVSDAANSSYKDMDNVLAKDYGFKDGASSATEYQYDLNGNMKRDANKGLANVEYNYLNLPQTLTGSDNKIIEYIYDANGQKLAKTADGETTYYAGNMVYKESSLQYILHAEGKYEITENDAHYQFDIKDHLGNVRLVVNKNGTELQQSAYYPFGMEFQKGGNANNKYLYNGKELQEDKIGGASLDWYDYGARFYEPSLGRWHVVDPLLQYDSPYTYCNNNPISIFDPTGMWGEYIASTFIDDDGNIIEHRDDGDPRIYLVSDVDAWRKGGSKKSDAVWTGKYENKRTDYSLLVGQPLGFDYANSLYGGGHLPSGSAELISPEYEIIEVIFTAGGMVLLKRGSKWVLKKFTKEVAEEVVEEAVEKGIKITISKFGHTFSKHGMNATEFVINRAKGSGKAVGQFLDDQKAAQFILDNLDKLKNGAVNIPIPDGFPARIVMPDGKTFKAATHIKLVPGGKGVKTAYPLIE